MSAHHLHFTASPTAYLRNLSKEGLQECAWAVYYQKALVKKEDGTTSMSWNFPVLIVSTYSSAPEALAARVARILEAHWDDPQWDEPEQPVSATGAA